ncbi:MAG: glutamyl-tRNA reductase [Spirochaetes bacterium]|nr:glutamyl-tRNA reductase [Spirochaetota bacterium]
MKKIKKIPDIGLIGISHKTAPIHIREKFSLDDSKLSKVIERAESIGIEEIVCISTCNRVEIYFTSVNMDHSAEGLIKTLGEISSSSITKLENILYKKFSKDAVIHLLTVASSLDSMVLGENEILSQVKDAYRNSAIINKTGTILNKLFHQAFRTAKLVRTETAIAKNPLSIAFIAVELANNIFKGLSKRKALLIGAGEMGELILKYLTKYKINDITIANRSFHNAQSIIDRLNIKANVITLDDIENQAEKTDIIIASSASIEYIITKETAKHILKQKNNNPLFIIDIAVPRNIDPAAGKLENIYLYNIDNLKNIADENLKSRLNELKAAESLIESDAEKFYEWYENLAIVPAIINIRNKFDEIRKHEFNKYAKRKLKHLSAKDLEIIDNLTIQIMTRTLHDPIMYIKGYTSYASKEKKKIKENIKIIEQLFGKGI